MKNSHLLLRCRITKTFGNFYPTIYSVLHTSNSCGPGVWYGHILIFFHYLYIGFQHTTIPTYIIDEVLLHICIDTLFYRTEKVFVDSLHVCKWVGNKGWWCIVCDYFWLAPSLLIKWLPCTKKSRLDLIMAKSGHIHSGLLFMYAFLCI